MSELLINLAILLAPALIVGFIFEWREIREIDSWQESGAGSPSHQQALASVKIMDMTVTNNNSPAFGATFFEDLEEGLRKLNIITEGREAL